MNRLWVWLTLAFTVVVLVTVGTVGFLLFRTTSTEFRRYITHSGMTASGAGIRRLVAHYEAQNSWDGVEELLGQGIVVSGPMNDQNRRPGPPGGRYDVLLADARGKVVVDSAGRATGTRLNSRDRSRALPLTSSDDGAVIGYLLLSRPGEAGALGRLEQQFLDRMQNLLIAAAVLAAGMGLILGALLSRSLTAPLQRLAVAARAVAKGDLSQKVKVEGSAEIAEVGQAFNEMTTALGKAEVLRQNMVADVAHELRTPLTVLQGNLRAILDEVYQLDKAEIARLYDESLLLGRLVDDLRELALADAGRLQLHLRPTDAGQIVRSALDNLEPVAQAQQVTLGSKVPESLPLVQADPSRVSQVLRNLLVNALHHTPPGGRVTAMGSQSNGAVEIAVSDTGEGISPEDLPHIFERFWRADPARTHGEKAKRAQGLGSGSGLGLSIAKSLVEAQGGRIWAESTPGQGTTFRFTLPLA